MLAGVRHIELYCKPKMIPFYKQWGFTSPGPDVNYLRLTRGATGGLNWTPRAACLLSVNL